MAPAAHASRHGDLHLPLVAIRQASGSTTAASGTAWAKGMYTAERFARPASNSSGIRPASTQASTQSPQPVHFERSTRRERVRTFAVKLPTKPDSSSTSLVVRTSMFLSRATSTIFGVRMQAEQSSVGKVLSSCAMWPPMLAERSTR